MSTQNKSKAGYAYGSIICILFAIFVERLIERCGEEEECEN